MIVPVILIEKGFGRRAVSDQCATWHAICSQSWMPQSGPQRFANTTINANGYGAPIICTPKGLELAVREEIGSTDRKRPRIVVEPSFRKHAITFASAALIAESTDLLLIMTTDAEVSPSDRLINGIDRSLEFAANGWLITFTLNESCTSDVQEDATFLDCSSLRQNPSRDTLPENIGIPTGITLVNASVLLTIISEAEPAVYTAAEIALYDSVYRDDTLFLDFQAYLGGQSPNLFSLIFDRYDHIAVVNI